MIFGKPFPLHTRIPRRSIREPQYGLGTHGGNVEFYMPAPGEVLRTCARFRERWTPEVEMERRQRIPFTG